jgi:hypothetical protein
MTKTIWIYLGMLVTLRNWKKKKNPTHWCGGGHYLPTYLPTQPPTLWKPLESHRISPLSLHAITLEGSSRNYHTKEALWVWCHVHVHIQNSYNINIISESQCLSRNHEALCVTKWASIGWCHVYSIHIKIYYTICTCKDVVLSHMGWSVSVG